MRKLTFDTRFEILRFSVSILISVLLAFVIVLIVSDEPLNAARQLFLGPVSSVRRFGNVIELAITLSFTGLAVAVMFSANQFNMGAEGGVYAGGAVATMFALSFSSLPVVLGPALAILCGGLVGAVVCVLPAIIKQRWGASELVSSLMLNYVFFYFTRYFANTTFKDPTCGYVATYLIPENYVLPVLFPGTRIHFGLIVMLVVLALTYVYVNRTKHGFRLIQTGRNISFARYAGVNTSLVIISSQIIGGFIAGLGGSVEIFGMYSRFQWQSLPNYGFDGIVVSILAKNKPAFIPLAAFFLAYLRIGADRMAIATDIPSEMISIIQGIIIMLVGAKAFLASRRQKLLNKEMGFSA